MKNNIKSSIVTLLITGSFLWTSCGDANTKKTEKHHHKEGMEHHEDKHSDEVSEIKPDKEHSEIGMLTILDSYFLLNAKLVEDDAEGAAEVGKGMVIIFDSFDKSQLKDEQLEEFNEIQESARENVEHISKNANEIGHQREHLVSLSEDVRDLIELIGVDEILYEDYCPMADNGKGAIWISRTEEISNPYMGSSMPKCGKINRKIG